MNDRLTSPLSTVPFPVEEFLQDSGIVPSRELALKFMYCAFERLDQEGGSVPVKLLLLKSMLRSVIKSLQAAGMLPASKICFNLALHGSDKRVCAVECELLRLI